MIKKNKKIRIGIDARFFGPFQKGLGRYVQKLVENLEYIYKTESDKEFIIFLRKSNFNEYNPKNPNFKKVLADYRWYSFKEQIFMPFKIRKEKIDLMHFCHFNVPLLLHKKFVVTIHDLVLKRFPTRRASTLGPLRYFIKQLFYKLVIYLAIKRAKKIIAVSNFAKKEILFYFKINENKVEVIYEGASDFFRCKGSCSNSSLKKFGINMPYILYVGNAYPHKNLERLIFAFKKLIQKYKLNLQLVFAGEIDYFYKKLQDKISNYKLPIIFTGFISDNDLYLLYKNALIYVFPSLCEGFGLPPLEAMSFGVPVVCSDKGALPEILGDSAVYFDPVNINDIAEKIRFVFKNNKLRKELRKKGFCRIKNYSWEEMARRTLEVYKDVI